MIGLEEGPAIRENIQNQALTPIGIHQGQVTSAVTMDNDLKKGVIFFVAQNKKRGTPFPSPLKETSLNPFAVDQLNRPSGEVLGVEMARQPFQSKKEGKNKAQDRRQKKNQANA